MALRVPHATLVDLLALTLGGEKGQSIWSDAVRGLSIPVGDSYTREQALAVLSALASAPGSTGLAARVARLRLEGDEPEPTLRWGSSAVTAFAASGASSDKAVPSSAQPARGAPRAPEATDGDRRPPASSQRSRTIEQGGPISSVAPAPMEVDLLSFLTPSLGEEKAAEAVQQHAKTLRLNPSALSRADALALLEAMSSASGLLGVVARFAKVRFLLRYPG